MVITCLMKAFHQHNITQATQNVQKLVCLGRLDQLTDPYSWF